MITEKTRRRHRGRAIRKANRVRQFAAAFGVHLDRWQAAVLTRLLSADAVHFIRVFTARMTPLPLTPRGGAGARRQLLDNGRAPRKGGR